MKAKKIPQVQHDKITIMQFDNVQMYIYTLILYNVHSANLTATEILVNLC